MAAYVTSSFGRLQNDKTLVVEAAGNTQKAADNTLAK
jgi:hypothetical protein